MSAKPKAVRFWSWSCSTGKRFGTAISMPGATARKAYQDFLALWKDADSILPVLAEARKEYAAL
jgi:hypothetical protein